MIITAKDFRKITPYSWRSKILKVELVKDSQNNYGIRLYTIDGHSLTLWTELESNTKIMGENFCKAATLLLTYSELE